MMTAIALLPIALFNSTATTDESTPPLTAVNTFPDLPTVCCISAIFSLIKLPGVQVGLHFAILNKNNGLDSEKIAAIRSKIIYFSNEFSDQNLSCVYRIASIYGLTKADCEVVFSQFQGLPHRRQLVRRIDGISFINDSKATNPSSTIWALQNSKDSVILLAGGKDKGLDYSVVAPYLGRVKKLNLFGEAATLIRNSLESHVPTQLFSSLEDAVTVSFSQAKKGDTILLSPMCASFDMFSNYQERGSKFSEIVNSLKI